MKILKTAVLISLSLVSIAGFTGCERLGTELSELMIIQGIGIDAVADSYRVTIEVLNNEQKGTAGGEDSGGQKTLFYTGEGETVSAAIGGIVSKSGNTPLYAHNRVIILGEQLAERDLSDLLDFFQRDYNTRPTVLLAVARGASAAEVLEAKVTDGTVHSETIENIIAEGHIASLCVKTRIIDAVNQMADEYSGTVLTAITAEKKETAEPDGQSGGSGSGGQSGSGSEGQSGSGGSAEQGAESQYSYRLAGTAVFGTDHKLEDYLNEEETRGLLYLTDKANKGVISVTLPGGGKSAFRIVHSKTKVEVSTEGEFPVFKVKTEILCDLNELENERQRMNSDSFDVLKRSASAELEKEMYAALTILQVQLKTDALRYGRWLWKENPEYFEAVKPEWESMFFDCEIRPEVSVTVRRIGEVSFFSK